MLLSPPKTIVITLLTSLLLLISCGTDESIKARYEAERLYSQADKLSQEAYIRPELGTGEGYDQIYNAYQRALTFTLTSVKAIDSSVHRREYAELSLLAHRAATRLTKMHFADGQFDSCITLMTTLLENVRLGREEQITVYYNLAQALQSDGQFDSAMAVYDNTIESFNPPLDPNGQPILEILNLPMFLVRIFTQTGDSTKAHESYGRAENYYQNFLKTHPGTNLAMTANGNLARLYYDSRRWDDAIAYLNRMTDSTDQVTLTARFRIADIQITFLKDYPAGLATLDQVQESLEGRDTIFIPVVWFKKSLVALASDRMLEARNLINEIQKLYPNYNRANPRVQYTKARTFDLEGNWDRAESEYQYLIEQHGESREGLATYLYLAGQLADRNRKSEADEWYEKADQQYTLLAARGVGTIREAVALTYKADLYRAQARWDDAASTLTTIYGKFSDTKVGRDCLLTAASIYRQKLDQPGIADSLTTELKKDLPIESPDWES